MRRGEARVVPVHLLRQLDERPADERHDRGDVQDGTRGTEGIRPEDAVERRNDRRVGKLLPRNLKLGTPLKDQRGYIIVDDQLQTNVPGIWAIGASGVAAVLGVAAVVCVSSAVAGEMLQDLKVGHILGGTPSKMQIGDLFGIVVASLVLFFPVAILDRAYHFGSPKLPAPQAGLMAMLSKGIVGGDMAWPLVIVGILLGLAMIMIEVKSVMLFAVGMYLPLGTTFAIFLGGVIRWFTDRFRDRRGFNDAQKARVDNSGVLTASGLIAGEAILAVVLAIFICAYYQLMGVISTISLLINLLLLIAVLSMLQATLTLPGIAAVALTLGMAIDANVLINERIREEVRSGKSPVASIEAGYQRAMTTIIDSNMTTLISTLVLF